MYPSNCDDIDISNAGVIATCCYGTMVTMLSWYNCSYLYIDKH